MIPLNFNPSKYACGTSDRSGGFTLIEIIVVVAIIGVMVAFLGLSLSRDTDRLASLEARRFHAIVNEVRDEAILAGRGFLLIVDEDSGSYFFNSVQANRQVSFDDGLLQRRNLEPGVTLQWQVFDQIDDQNDTPPRVLITPLGEITPFSTSFIGKENTYLVLIDERGNLVLNTEKNRLF